MAITLPIAPLARHLAPPARLLADRMRGLAAFRARAMARQAAARVQASLPLAARVHVPILFEPPEDGYCRDIVARHAAQAEAGEWHTLLAALTEADQARAAAPGGRRLAALISAGARSGLTAAISRGDRAGAEAALERLTAVAAAHDGSYAAAQILARAHLDLGWARRSAAAEPQDGHGHWQGFLSHVAKAEEILDAFDPIAENAPLLAATRYDLAHGLEDGAQLFRDWYEDWSDLDPTSAEPHAAHAINLLPSWYGRAEPFDDEARAAARRTGDVCGAAPYAVLHMTALEATGEMMPGLDIGLYVRGLLDFHHVTDCQYRANIAAAAMAERVLALTAEAEPNCPRLRLATEILEDHLTGNLREFHLTAWDQGEAGIHSVLGLVFPAQLARGEHVFLDPEGMVTRPG